MSSTGVVRWMRDGTMSAYCPRCDHLTHNVKAGQRITCWSCYHIYFVPLGSSR